MENQTKTIDKQEHYLQNRWQDQEEYHAKKATRYKRWHLGLQVMVALGAVSVPVLLGITSVPKVAPTLLSLLVAIATAIENVFHFGENWRSFRYVSETLKRERFLFEVGAGPYKSSKTALLRFVENCESVINAEVKRFMDTGEEREQASQGQGDLQQVNPINENVPQD